MPAQQITPPRGRCVELETHESVAFTAEEMESEEVTSVLEKRVRSEEVRAGNTDVPDSWGGFKSSMETLAPTERRAMAVARPRPDDLVLCQ